MLKTITRATWAAPGGSLRSGSGSVANQPILGGTVSDRRFKPESRLSWVDITKLLPKLYVLNSPRRTNKNLRRTTRDQCYALPLLHANHPPVPAQGIHPPHGRHTQTHTQTHTGARAHRNAYTAMCPSTHVHAQRQVLIWFVIILSPHWPLSHTRPTHAAEYWAEKPPKPMSHTDLPFELPGQLVLAVPRSNTNVQIAPLHF